ncbi:MAG: hypothetical protein U9R03_01355 [Candidatus Aerophobetes bacterium]|nr:hypothetical protein [Candidatus Aerophobetes bacterium]
MNRVDALDKTERLKLLEELKSGEIEIEDFKLDVHTNFKDGPEVTLVDVKCIYLKRLDERFFITEMKSSEFFTSVHFNFQNKICTISYKSISGDMGIIKTNLDASNEKSFYEVMLLETNEFHDFFVKEIYPDYTKSK